MSVAREKTVTIILEYLLVLYNPEALMENMKVEWDSRLKAGTLASMRWIKLLQRCTEGQRTTHLIARLKIPEAANQVIRDGVDIAGKRTWAR